MTSQPSIQIRAQDLGQIWRLSQAQASRISQPARIDGLRDFGVDLVKALELRKITCTEEEFEEALRRGATSEQGDPVELARELMLYDFYFEWTPPPRQKNGMRAVLQDPKFKTALADKLTADARSAQEALEREILIEGNERASVTVPDVPIRSAGDLLASMRTEKLRADLERTLMKTRRESGELIERAEIEAAMIAAGAIVRSTLSTLPAQIAGLVGSLVGPEVEEEIFNKCQEKVDRALHAIMKALATEEENDDLDSDES